MDTTVKDQWAELHPDLLNEIVKHTYSYDDYIQLRAVCKSWNLELPMIPNHHHPWLVLAACDDENETMGLDEKGFYHLRLPEMKDFMLCGACYGRLIIVNIDGTIQMMNPFMKAKFDLPHMSTFPDVVAYQPDKHDHEYVLCDIKYRDEIEEGDDDDPTYTRKSIKMLEYHVHKIILSSSDFDDQDFMAAAIYGAYSRLSLYRFGDNRWVDVPTKEKDCDFRDVIFFEGKIYVIDGIAQLYEFDMKTGLGGISKVPQPNDIYIPSINWCTTYLVKSPDDGLLLVTRHLEFYSNPNPVAEGRYAYKTSGFDIHRLNKDAKQWSRVFSLGNYVLVLGHNSSSWVFPYNFPDGKGNRIYYTDNMLETQKYKMNGGHDIGFLDLDDGRLEASINSSQTLPYSGLPRFGYSKALTFSLSASSWPRLLAKLFSFYLFILDKFYF